MIAVEALSKTYGEGSNALTAIGDLSFAVERGEFLSLVGPSGCGKTTLLKCVCGLLSPTSGAVRLHGRPVSGPASEMALVFQDYSRSLFPWQSVIRNVEFPLLSRGGTSAARRRAAAQALSAVGLVGFEERYPWELSGGMQQRVAIARALAYESEVLLMDEPFASVDAQTRADLEDLLLDVQARFGVTVIFVTHDIDESVYLSDRVLVLERSPTAVQECVEIGLPRPRDQIVTKELPEFTQLRGHIYRAIKGAPEPRLA